MTERKSGWCFWSRKPRPTQLVSLYCPRGSRWSSGSQVALGKAHWNHRWHEKMEDTNDSASDLSPEATFHLHSFIWMCDFEAIFSSDFLARRHHEAAAPLGNEAPVTMAVEPGEAEGGMLSGSGLAGCTTAVNQSGRAGISGLGVGVQRGPPVALTSPPR